MSLTLTQTYTAVGPNITSSFLASGGTAPYVYSVVPGGAGGTIDSSTGIYTAPSSVNVDPSLTSDTIQVTDSLAATATAQIFITTAFGLLTDIIQKYMGLDSKHIFWWDQKTFQPTDSGLYVILSEMSCKPFSNISDYDSSGNSVQIVNMSSTVGIDIISRGPAARDQKGLIIAALNSVYSQQQQTANSFYVALLSTAFTNLSNIDGAAIPYRYNISVALQYFVKRVSAVGYYDTLQTPVMDINQ